MTDINWSVCNLKVQIILNIYTVILSITNKWSHPWFVTEMEAMKDHLPWEHTVAQIHLQESSLTVTNYGYNFRVISLIQGLDSQLPGMDHWQVNGKELFFLEESSLISLLILRLPCSQPVFSSCILSLLSILNFNIANIWISSSWSCFRGQNKGKCPGSMVYFLKLAILVRKRKGCWHRLATLWRCSFVLQ